MLGTVDAPDGRQLTVADVPGLIEGASEGVGLGHEFLAHLERARMLVHVIDAAAGDPAEQWAQIDRELAAYGAGLDSLPQIVVLNKIDLLRSRPSSASRTSGSSRSTRSRRRPAQASRSSSRALFQHIPEPEPIPEESPEGLADFLVYRPQPRGRRFRIFRTDTGYRVVGPPAGGRGAGGGAEGRGREERRRGRDRGRARRARMKGILGGTFDPPHNGHVALAEAARTQLPIEELEIWVEEHPGHRGVVADPEARLKMAQAAFPGLTVRLDPNPFTVEAVRGREEALFVVGADQAADFATWKEPEEVLESGQARGRHARRLRAARPQPLG